MQITTAKELVQIFKSKGWAIDIVQDTETHFMAFVSNLKHTRDSFDVTDHYGISVSRSVLTNRWSTLITYSTFTMGTKNSRKIGQLKFIHAAETAWNYKLNPISRKKKNVHSFGIPFGTPINMTELTKENS